MKMFMYMAAFDAYIYADYIGCTFNPIQSGYYKIVAWTFYFSATPQSYYRAAESIYATSILLERLFWVPTLLFSICISIDLVIVVRNPFSSHKSRTWYYYVVTAIISVMTACLKLLSTLQADRFTYGLAYLEIIEYIVFLIFSIASIVIAAYRLLQPGVKKQLRTLIIKRHLLYIFTFLVCNMYIVLLVSHFNKRNP